jgi:uncharacterized Zn-binding protein involved in type VI secretion
MAGKGIQRVGDPSSGGGIAIGPGHTNVLINGRPAAIPDTPFTPHVGCGPHTPQHCVGIIAVSGTAGTVRANGIPLVLDGGKDSCQHARIMGSTNVRAT